MILKFFQHYRHLFNFLIAAIALAVASAVASFLSHAYWFLLSSPVLVLFLIMVDLLVSKFFFRVILFDQDGINTLFLGKISEKFSWDSIVNVRSVTWSRTQSLRFEFKSNKESEEKSLILNISRKKLRILVKICSDQRVKKLLESIQLRF